jgi:TPR repeat protein
MKWYRRAVRDGSVRARYYLGLLLFKGGPGLEPDLQQAKMHLADAKRRGDSDAKDLLDSIYRTRTEKAAEAGEAAVLAIEDGGGGETTVGGA